MKWTNGRSDLLPFPNNRSRALAGSNKTGNSKADIVDIRNKQEKAADSKIPLPTNGLKSRRGCPVCGCKDADALLMDKHGHVIACADCGYGT